MSVAQERRPSNFNLLAKPQNNNKYVSKAEMSLAELFDFIRLHPDEMAGVHFEQKINQTIADEFIRIKAREDGIK